MAYLPHTLVTLSGKSQEVTAGDEIWQIGIRGLDLVSGDDTPVDPGQLQALADAVWAALTGSGGYWTLANNGIPPAVTLNEVKAANIGADGKYTAPPGIHNGNVAAAGTNTVYMPSFCCLAISWTTTVTYGRKLRYGRVYPPNFQLNPGIGAAVAAGEVSQVMASGHVLLTDVAQSGSEYSFTPCVVSASGGYAKITGVRVGNIVDTQRRRKNAVPETYVEEAYP